MNQSGLFFFTVISIKTTSGHQPAAAIDPAAPAPRATRLLGEAGEKALVLAGFVPLFLLRLQLQL